MLAARSTDFQRGIGEKLVVFAIFATSLLLMHKSGYKEPIFMINF